MSLKVWSRFQVKRNDNSILKLRIQDLPSDLYDDVMDFNIKYFVPDETFHKAAGIPASIEAMEECRSFVTDMLKDPAHHITICCLDDNPDLKDIGDILGVSTVVLTKREDDDDDFGDLEDVWDILPQADRLKTKEMQKFFELLEGLHSQYNLLEHFDVQQYYDGRGVVVHPKYRKLGIATELLVTRRKICKSHNIPLTAAWMTSRGSQKAAERDGWQTVFDTNIRELEEKYGVFFSDSPQFCKLMIAEID